MDGQPEADGRRALRNTLLEPLALFDRIEEATEARARAADVARFAMLAGGEIG